MDNLTKKITKKQSHSGKVGCWLHSRCFLVIIPDYRIQGKNIRLHLQAHSDLFPSLICIQPSELRPILNSAPCRITDFSIIKHKAFSDLEIFGLGASLIVNKFSTIPGDLFTEVTINRQVKVKSGPMRCSYSTSIDAETDFILNFHILAKLRKELKNKMNLKTDSNHKE